MYVYICIIIYKLSQIKKSLLHLYPGVQNTHDGSGSYVKRIINWKYNFSSKFHYDASNNNIYVYV